MVTSWSPLRSSLAPLELVCCWTKKNKKNKREHKKTEGNSVNPTCPIGENCPFWWNSTKLQLLCCEILAPVNGAQTKRTPSAEFVHSMLCAPSALDSGGFLFSCSVFHSVAAFIRADLKRQQADLIVCLRWQYLTFVKYPWHFEIIKQKNVHEKFCMEKDKRNVEILWIKHETSGRVHSVAGNRGGGEKRSAVPCEQRISHINCWRPDVRLPVQWRIQENGGALTAPAEWKNWFLQGQERKN